MMMMMMMMMMTPRMLIATQNKVDVTSIGPFLGVAGIVLLLLVLVGVFWASRALWVVIAGK